MSKLNAHRRVSRRRRDPIGKNQTEAFGLFDKKSIGDGRLIPAPIIESDVTVIIQQLILLSPFLRPGTRLGGGTFAMLEMLHVASSSVWGSPHLWNRIHSAGSICRSEKSCDSVNREQRKNLSHPLIIDREDAAHPSLAFLEDSPITLSAAEQVAAQPRRRCQSRLIMGC